ncbi:MAG TPA: hypothetical protein VEW48_10095 [Thermoanaerobaculia bacterium]|nr:hypothetical protein [Thermoanaerobaculia bacterium]
MRRSLPILACLSLLSFAGASFAIEPKQGNGFLDRFAVSDPRLHPAPVTVPIEEAGSGLAPGVADGWAAFRQAQEGDWQGYVDRRSGFVETAEGTGVPWIPGPGNSLTLQDVATRLSGAAVDLRGLESIARAFLPRVSSLLGVDPQELVLSQERSGRFGDQVWYVDFDVKRGGRTIEGARVVFRVSQGNLVQYGTENLPAPGQGAPAKESVRREEALATLAARIRGFTAADTFLDGGSLHLLPVALADPRFTEGFAAGDGRGLALVWEFVFRRKKETGTWRARIDAVTGDLLELVDTNRYARAQGGVYPVSYSASPETVLPMPFADVSPAGSTDSSGFYTYPGSPTTSHLDGPYAVVYDYCGSTSLTSGGSGRLSFGTSAGTDCVTPGVGGPGNTHATRSQFYYVNRIKEVGRGWLPANTWLQAQLPAIVNIFQTCNAYWDGYSINFFRSGGGCGNTGEIAGVSLHEFGHGLDEHDGGGDSPDYGTSEAYADITAALTLRDSCVGPGFFTSGTCDGFGDTCTSCSAVRDLDWAKHVSNTPHTVGNFTQIRCPDYGYYEGPCGLEGHCESEVITEALWDLGARDLPGAGTSQAWLVAERLWYLSRPTATSAFTCTTSTNPWTSNGCATGSLWRTMRAIDDDDGNLANGTPHSCNLYAAFNRHGIACTTDPGANVCFSACTPPAAPTLSATAGQEQVQLAWSGGGGLVYDVYESESGCSSGWRRIANDLNATSLLDTTVFPGLPHSYQVIAHAPGAEACASPPSSCQSATPTGPACVPPSPPAGVTAQALGIDRIRVSWSAAAGTSDYEIWRAPAAGGPYVRIATVAAPATTWTDANLAMGTTYFYVVRSAFDDCASGDSAVASATTASCQNTTLYVNDFETGSGLSDWTSDGASADWRGIQTCAAHSGSRIFRFGGPGCSDSYQDYQSSAVQVRGTAGVQVPTAASSSHLAFWHRWRFESCCDGGWLTLAVDGGSPVFVPSSAFVSGGYPNTYRFTGTQDTFVRSEVNLDQVCNLATGGSDGCAGRALRIAFAVSTDGSVVDTGWFLDDVTVTSCILHGCTGAPQIGSAVASGDNQVQVTWSNGSPASSSFNVYRALGTCAQPGSFEKVASGVAGLSRLDAPVSGGVSWAYEVAGLDGSGLCESDFSGCVQVTPTGPCTLPPAFAGLASATNAATATCGVDLAWPAAASRCGNNPVSYEVYRSTAAGFTPGPTTWIASGIAGTAWRDDTSLADRTTYHYIVRAIDAGNGQAEGNKVEQSAATTGEIVPWTLTESFEAAGGFDNPGWQHHALSGPNDWKWSTLWDHSSIHSWLSPSYAGSSDRELVSPPFRATADTTLSFWHTYELDGCYDGGTLEISANNGATWSVLPDAAFTAGGFNGTIYEYSNNPLHGLRVWCGGTAGDLTQVVAGLSAWQGQDVRLRWHAGDDSYIRYLGWFVDDVRVDNARQILACQPTAPPPPAPLDFYSLAPCRLIDTRGPAGSLGAPILQPQGYRTFNATGSCGIPATARALVLNVTVVQPAGPGYVAVFPTGVPVPLVSTINFATGQIRSNITIVPLGLDTGAVVVKNGSGGVVHLVVDVTGYYE